MPKGEENTHASRSWPLMPYCAHARSRKCTLCNTDLYFLHVEENQDTDFKPKIAVQIEATIQNTGLNPFAFANNVKLELYFTGTVDCVPL